MKYLRLYQTFLRSFIAPKAEIKVIFDPSNGTAGSIIKTLFRKTKVKAILINSRPDGHFPSHSPNPLDKGAKTSLIKKVIKERADLGVIFDADGDRALFIDNLGRAVPGDAMARLLISYLKPKKVVIDTITGFLVRDKKDLGGNFKIFNSRVGGYFLNKKMKETKAEFGAEKSGHYYFKEFYYWDSGILSSLLVINALSELKNKGKVFADWIETLPRYYSIDELNLRVGNREKYLEALKKVLKKRGGTLSFEDGLTLRHKDFWLNVRASETQPVIRVNLEARDRGTFLRGKGKIVSLLKEITSRSTIH